MFSRGVATGVYRYIYPPNQSTLQIFMWLPVVFFLFDPGQFDIVPVYALARVSFTIVVLFTCGTLTCFDLETGMTSYNLYPLPQINNNNNNNIRLIESSQNARQPQTRPTSATQDSYT